MGTFETGRADGESRGLAQSLSASMHDILDGTGVTPHHPTLASKLGDLGPSPSPVGVGQSLSRRLEASLPSPAVRVAREDAGLRRPEMQQHLIRGLATDLASTEMRVSSAKAQHEELASLRSEITSLLRTNTALQDQVRSGSVHVSASQPPSPPRAVGPPVRSPARSPSPAPAFAPAAALSSSGGGGLSAAARPLSSSRPASPPRGLVGRSPSVSEFRPPDRASSPPSLRAGEAIWRFSGVMKERDDLASRISLEETRRKSAERRLGEQDQELRHALESANELARKNHEIEREKIDRERLAARLSDEVKAKEASQHGYEQRLETREKQLSEYHVRLQQADVAVEQQRSDLAKARDRAEVLEQELGHARQNHQRGEWALSEAEGALAELRVRCDKQDQQLRSQEAKATLDLACANEELKGVRKQLEAAEERNALLVKEKAEAAVEAERLAGEYAADRERFREAETAWASEKSSLTTKLSSRMAENEALSLDHGRAKAMLEEESRKNDDLIAKVGPLETQVMSLGAEILEKEGRAKSTLAEMDRRCRALMQKLEEERRRSSDLSRELGAAYEAARLLQLGSVSTPHAAARSRPGMRAASRRWWRGRAPRRPAPAARGSGRRLSRTARAARPPRRAALAPPGPTPRASKSPSRPPATGPAWRSGASTRAARWPGPASLRSCRGRPRCRRRQSATTTRSTTCAFLPGSYARRKRCHSAATAGRGSRSCATRRSAARRSTTGARCGASQSCRSGRRVSRPPCTSRTRSFRIRTPWTART